MADGSRERRGRGTMWVQPRRVQRTIRIPVGTELFGVVAKDEVRQRCAAREDRQLNFVVPQNNSGPSVEVSLGNQQDSERKNR